MGQEFRNNDIIITSETTPKVRIDWMGYFSWVITIVISFFPLLVDMVVHLGTNHRLDKSYWLGICLRGDVLWVFATMIVLDVIDYFLNSNIRRTKLRDAVASVLIAVWGLCFAMWGVFKYAFSASYDGDLPIWIAIAVAGLVIILGSPLHVKEAK